MQRCKNAILFSLRFAPLILFCALLCSCKDYNDLPTLGTITFSTTHDCDLRLFNSKGDQVAREHLEAERPPIVINMKETGVFIIHAEAEGMKTIKEPITYHSGNIEHYIEF